ncbi:hypothetical protein INR49_014691, partial [Caranx melampygus]
TQVPVHKEDLSVGSSHKAATTASEFVVCVRAAQVVHVSWFQRGKMASGFCVRVLLLSLLAVGQNAQRLSYRSGGVSGIKPHFDPAIGFPKGHKPDIASPGYESSAQSGGFLASSSSSYPDSDSFQNLKPADVGYKGGSYGRQVDGHSRDGSVTSYRPSKPRENPQQPHSHPNLDANVFQTKVGMWAVASPHSGNRFESGIASSNGIEMVSAGQSETRLQEDGYPAKPQSTYPAQPQPHPSPQQPAYPAKPQPQPRPGPQQPTYPAKPQPRPGPQQPTYPAKPQPRPGPQQPAYLAKPQPHPGPQQPAYPAKPQPQPRPGPQQPMYPAKPQ